jgi:hypothetical protein
MPVTTTLRAKFICRLADFFRILVGDFDVEAFFEGHDELDGVERIRA